jgi:hypothetical protein
MQILKELLKATINYQDVMDELFNMDYDVNVSSLQHKMLDLSDEAKKRYPALMAKYSFEYQKDRQVEFDALQLFINDFNGPLNATKREIDVP